MRDMTEGVAGENLNVQVFAHKAGKAEHGESVHCAGGGGLGSGTEQVCLARANQKDRISSCPNHRKIPKGIITCTEKQTKTVHVISTALCRVPFFLFLFILLLEVFITLGLSWVAIDILCGNRTTHAVKNGFLSHHVVGQPLGFGSWQGYSRSHGCCRACAGCR